MDICGDELMEDEWEEGFTCNLPKGHAGPHRDQLAEDNRNESISNTGKPYRWTFEWEYADGSTHLH